MCERLSPPIQEITPRPGEPPVPFRCEVLVRPSTCGGRGGGDTAKTSPASQQQQQQGSSSSSTTTATKNGLTHYLRGWAQVRATTCEKSGRRYVSLRQQVAPRTVTRSSAVNDQNDDSGRGGPTGGDKTTNSASAQGASWPVLESAAPQTKLPPAVFSALGRVARGRKGLETLVTQDVTYVGPQLRIGRTREGDLFVYERCNCAWPNNKWL